MRGHWLTKLGVASGLVALACGGDETLLPTQPAATVVAHWATACRASDATAIEAEIKALYPETPALRGAALSQFASVKKQCTKNPADAQAKAVRLAGFAAKKFLAHRLLRTATAAGVSSHINHLFRYVGLPEPGNLAAALSGGGAAASVGPSDPTTNVVTGDGQAGVSIPPGAISTTQTVLVTVTPAADQTNPLPTSLPQYGPFYDFHTFPLVTAFAQPVTIGICATVPQAVAGRIQLARPDASNPATAIEILARGPAATFLGCSPLPVASRRVAAEPLAGAGQPGLVGRLLAAATGLLRPTQLYAGGLQLEVTGGITARSDNFGNPPTGPIDPLSMLVFTTQPSTTVAGQPITPPVVVAVQSGVGQTISSYTGQVTVTIGTNPSGGTLTGSGTLVDGVATFAFSIDQPGTGYTLAATASGTDPTPASATSDPFDITAPGLAFASISARNDHSCGVTTSGAAYCWGSGNLGRLGNGTTTSSLTPVPVSGGLTFAAMSAGAEHTCGVTTSHDIYCWGRNSYGQLGNGTTTDNPTTVPVLVPGGLVFASVSAGAEHTCGVTTTGEAWCWGLNDAGQLGNYTITDSPTPVAVLDGHVFAAVSAGDFHTCAVTTAGDGYCWGYNQFGQLGIGSTTDTTAPAMVSGGLIFATVSAGNPHSCGVTTNGSAYCWGRNAFGQLGDNTTTDATTPVLVSGGLTFTTVSAGRSIHTCGVTSGGNAYCWGRNDFGELGNGSTNDTPIPVLVSGGLHFATMSAGAIHTCAVTTSQAAYCWGYNFSGQLGDGTTANASTPVPVGP